MKRNNKKGFTIVELTIVIAVIAILAAVLIPTFSSVVDKANQSADIQLIRQANVVLQAATADGSSLTKAEAEEELKNNSITLGEPSGSDNEFYYIEEKACYVIWNRADSKISYPEDVAQSLKNWTPGNSAVRIGSTYYATLKEAVDGAAAGNTIYLLKDIETSEQVFINKDIIVDFGGHTYKINDFKMSSAGYNWHAQGAIAIWQKTNVTFKNGSIKAIGQPGGKENYAVHVVDANFIAQNITLDLKESNGMRGGLAVSGLSTVKLSDSKLYGMKDDNSKGVALFLDNWVANCSFNDGEYLSMTIDGESVIEGIIQSATDKGACIKLSLESGTYQNVEVKTSNLKAWKIKTPDGNKLSGMDNFSDTVDAEGYYTYPKS